MNPASNRDLPCPPVILAGPTGVGKTELATGLAEDHPYELVSADSMQLYRGMEIGTGQPTAGELGGVRLHGCGLLNPDEPFDVQRFLELSGEIHNGIVARGAVPLYVGGTGMYLRALRWGLVELPSIPPGIRRGLEARWERGEGESLFEALRVRDPELAGRIPPTDRIRVIRGLEVYEATGRKLSDLQAQWNNPQPRFQHRLVVLNAPREALYRRIERRVDAMFEAGWIGEAEALLAAGYPESLHAFKAIGYREIFAMLRGERSEAETRNLIKAKTRQFAKRQLTWFRREREALWLEYSGGDVREALKPAEKILESLRRTP